MSTATVAAAGADASGRYRIVQTPLAAFETLIRGRWKRVEIKMESVHPSGSIKYRTACALAAEVLSRADLPSDVAIVESSSGNLALSLAMLCRQEGVPFTAVVDPYVPPARLNRLREFAATVEMVHTPDAHGSYLLARLDRVAALRAENPRLVWTNQYANPANPAVHRETTGPEILRQTSGAVDCLLVAVSTGGTARGVLDACRRSGAATGVIGVDAVGSRAFGGPSATRRLTGIGASRTSEFVRAVDLDAVVHVVDRSAFSECWQFRADTGVALGGSSGAVLAAAREVLHRRGDIRRPVCISADAGDDYAETIYNPAWIEAVLGSADAVDPGSSRWRSAAS